MNNNIYYIIAAAIVVFITALVVVLSINRGTCQLDETATNCTKGVSGWDGICSGATKKTQCLAFEYDGQKCCKWVKK